jgi:hypothetical protein
MRAFAGRRPALLRRVYPAGPLRAADSALLDRIVPRGCGLVGAHTHYARVRVLAHGPRTVLLVRAALTASRLRCPGRADVAVRGVGPTTLRIVLAEASDGYRITGQQVIGPG